MSRGFRSGCGAGAVGSGTRGAGSGMDFSLPASLGTSLSGPMGVSEPLVLFAVACGGGASALNMLRKAGPRTIPMARAAAPAPTMTRLAISTGLKGKRFGEMNSVDAGVAKSFSATVLSLALASGTAHRGGFSVSLENLPAKPAAHGLISPRGGNTQVIPTMRANDLRDVGHATLPQVGTNFYSFPGSRLGTRCLRGSASRCRRGQAEPGGQGVPRRSLGTRERDVTFLRFDVILRYGVPSSKGRCFAAIGQVGNIASQRFLSSPHAAPVYHVNMGNKKASVTFWGAAQSVTGSMHLVEAEGRKILLDCGLHLGPRSQARERNTYFPFDPRALGRRCC